MTGRLRDFHMTKFAGAVMYVLKTVLNMDDRFMIAAPDAKAGRMLLDNILKGGNFGMYNDALKAIRQADSPLGSFFRRERYNMRLLRNYTEEYFSEITYRIFSFSIVSIGTDGGCGTLKHETAERKYIRISAFRSYLQICD